MYYIIYKTTNLINGKFYIGKHQTKNLDDGYLGSGKLLKRAIEKYGFSNFRREVLETLNSVDELNLTEKKYITEDLVNDRSCYNLKLGGEGGFAGINSSHSKEHLDSIRSVDGCRKGGRAAARVNKEKQAGFYAADKDSLSAWGKKGSALSSKMNGKRHSDKTRLMMSKSHSGKTNSQFGSFWINNGVCSKKCRGPVPDGWVRGRKCK